MLFIRRQGSQDLMKRFMTGDGRRLSPPLRHSFHSRMHCEPIGRWQDSDNQEAYKTVIRTMPTTSVVTSGSQMLQFHRACFGLTSKWPTTFQRCRISCGGGQRLVRAMARGYLYWKALRDTCTHLISDIVASIVPWRVDGHPKWRRVTFSRCCFSCLPYAMPPSGWLLGSGVFRMQTLQPS